MTRRRAPAAAWASAAGVAAYGLVRARLPAPARFTGNLVAAAAAANGARLAGVDREGLGLSARSHGPGLGWGALAGSTAAAAVAGLAASGPARPFFADERVGAHSRRRAAMEASIRIPLETAVAEEVIFRGAVLGVARSHLGDAAAVAVSSVLFGLWHVPPALEAHGASAVAGLAGSGGGARAATVAGTVVATSAAGAVFAWLRLRSGSVIAPAIAHGSLNVAGFAAARLTTPH